MGADSYTNAIILFIVDLIKKGYARREIFDKVVEGHEELKGKYYTSFDSLYKRAEGKIREAEAIDRETSFKEMYEGMGVAISDLYHQCEKDYPKIVKLQKNKENNVRALKVAMQTMNGNMAECLRTMKMRENITNINKETIDNLYKKSETEKVTIDDLYDFSKLTEEENDELISELAKAEKLTHTRDIGDIELEDDLYPKEEEVTEEKTKRINIPSF